jgi:hypothetical protein
MHARDGMAFVHAVMCARASHLRTTTSQLIAPRIRGCRPAARPGAALSRYSSAPSYDLNARAGPPQTHACAWSVHAASWRSRGGVRGGRRRAGRCPSHVAPCSRRDRRGGRMCVHAAASFHNPPRLAMFRALHWPCISRRRSGGGRRAAAVRAR